MDQHVQQHHEGSLGSSNGSPYGPEKDRTMGDRKERREPDYPATYNSQTGEVYDPYGGKKLGMVRVGHYNPLPA